MNISVSKFDGTVFGMYNMNFDTTSFGVIFIGLGGHVPLSGPAGRATNKNDPTFAGKAESGGRATASSSVVAAAVSVAVAVSPAGILTFEGPLPEELLEAGEGGQE